MKCFVRRMIDLFLPSAGIYANHLTGEMNVRPLQSHRLKGMEQHAEAPKKQITAILVTEQDPAENAPKGEKRGRKSELAAVESASVAAVAQLVAHLIRKTGIFERLVK